ncbi:MAG: TetR/AcrR family transcriptional regulator [bacterium]|nr:TetR/AcrR family transcriptional regulator [bacterium]
MAKKTFLNLPKERQKTFLDRAYREFTLNSYDDASISAILKDLGMAKGSFYQYFDNKRALFDYLTEQVYATKVQYILSVKRENYENFWAYSRAMYEHGLDFDREHPLKSNFAYRLNENMDSPSVRETFVQWQKQGFETIKQMVKAEVDAGLFRDDIPLDSVALFYMNIGRQLVDQLRMTNLEDFNERIEAGRPLLADGNEELLFRLIDNNFALLSAALDKK